MIGQVLEVAGQGFTFLTAIAVLLRHLTTKSRQGERRGEED